MPMIGGYAPAGTFHDGRKLARDLATAVMTIERLPNIPLFRQNTAAFVHELPPDRLSNVDGDSACVRVQVLTNAGGLAPLGGSRAKRPVRVTLAEGARLGVAGGFIMRVAKGWQAHKFAH